MNFFKGFSFFLLSTVALFAFSQKIPESEFFRRMDEGQQLMLEGDYEAAQKEFLFILENKEVVPTDLAYLFGRNSFHLGEYKQSINWLNKYLQLKGTRGQYYAEAVQYLQFAEDKYQDMLRDKFADEPQDLSSQQYDCDGLDKMICPVCKGSGVIFRRGMFDVHYQTCPYCKGEGFLTCKDYNLFMMGRFQPEP